MSSQQQELFDWWAVVARQDAEMVVPKSVEYGSNSLEQVGRKMAQLQGRTVTKTEALELGCWSYAVGKMERWTDAVMRGELSSTDTLTDLGVYTTMARRIREVGDWPGHNVGSTCYHGDLDCESCDHHARPKSSKHTEVTAESVKEAANFDYHTIHRSHVNAEEAPCVECGELLPVRVMLKYGAPLGVADRLTKSEMERLGSLSDRVKYTDLNAGSDPIFSPDVCYHGDSECERCNFKARVLKMMGIPEAVVTDIPRNADHFDFEGRKTTPQGLTLNVGDEVRRVKDRDNPHGVEGIVKELNAEEDGSVRVGWPNRHADFWVWSNELDLTRRADQICEHKNVNVHTLQPGLPEDPTGVGTCLDCKREVTVKKPFGYTPTMNGAHE